MKKRSSPKDNVRWVILLVLVLVILFSGLRILESTVLYVPESGETPSISKTIVRDGVEYFPKQDITVVMVLGIDQFGPVQSSNYYRNEGAADSVILLIFDETDQECTVLSLNRDTMVDMDVLGVRGEYGGTTFGQLALAHTYGTGLKDSCENMKNTLMRFLPGMTVDHYVSMNMDALPILNHAVGGVRVTVTDDFSKINPSITMGELTLQDDQVIDYVRLRKDVGDQTNLTRMDRQKEFVNGFMKALYGSASKKISFLLKLHENLAPYVVTDFSMDTLSGMLNRYNGFTIVEAVTPEGENVVEDGHYAFYVDEDKLDDLIVELFYRAK